MPPLLRDPWALAALLSVVPLVLHSLGAPLGEPFADDFDYLHRVLLGGPLSFLDGGGSVLYWRPIGRQVYYSLLTPLILGSPGVVAALHVVALALIALLVYRTLRPHWSGPAAAAAAAFVPLSESTRMLAAWPSHFMDLGAMLFAALALHEASRRRWITALASVLASLLCKEVGALAFLLLPWMPSALPARARVRSALAVLGVLLVWGLAYRAVISHAHLLLAPAAVQGSREVSAAAKFVWAAWNSVRASFSLPVAGLGNPPAWNLPVLLAAIVLIIGAAVAALIDRGVRERVKNGGGWIAWGGAWFLAASVALTQVHPAWAPYRSAFGGIGLGIALVALVAAVSPWLIAALVALRLVAFALSPGPPATITEMPAAQGADFDFERLVRLGRIAAETRDALQKGGVRPAPGSDILMHNPPYLTGYAFAGDKAVQVWYRDSTLHWPAIDRYVARPGAPLAAVVEYEPRSTPQMVVVEPAAMLALLRATRLMSTGAWDSVLVELDLADSLERDPAARVFHGFVAGKRSAALARFGRYDLAEREGLRSLALWRNAPDARLTLAGVWALQGRLAEAEAELDTLLLHYPANAMSAAIRDSIRAQRGLPPRGGAR